MTELECKEIEGTNHTHLIFENEKKCAVCALPEEIFKKLDTANKEKIPVSKFCSECGEIIKLNTRFNNFALSGFGSLHCICEGCRIRYRELKK